MSVSGACYLSAMLGGRSGNRGLCAQPCRLDWACGDNRYALSLKDMSLLSHIRELADAGVCSFKIEGRMKRPEYVAAATTACRQALAGEAYDAEALRAVFARSGFTDGYLTGKRGADMFGYRTKEDVTDAADVLKPLFTIYRAETPLVPVDLAFRMDAQSTRLVVSDGTNEIMTSVGAPEPAIHRALDEAIAKKNLEKTGGTPFFVRSFHAELAEGYTLSAAALNALRRDALDELLELRGRTVSHARVPYEPPVPIPYVSSRKQPALWARFYRVEQIPTEESFERILLPLEQITKETVSRFGERLIAQLPTLLFPEDETAAGERLGQLAEQGLRAVWTNNSYGIPLAKRLGLAVHGGFGLNIANTSALLACEADELNSITVSFELAMAKILALGGTLPRGIVSYGYLPLMHVRNCPVRAAGGCGACNCKGELTDRKQIVFPVECDERRSATLLNSVPLDLADRPLAGLDFQLLYFTRETAEEAAAVADRYCNAQKTDQPHTGGLYYRTLL